MKVQALLAEPGEDGVEDQRERDHEGQAGEVRAGIIGHQGDQAIAPDDVA